MCLGLVAANLLNNDGWKQIAGFNDSFSVGEPGVTVTLHRPREVVLRDVIKQVFDGAAIVSQVDNVLPNEGLDKATEHIETAMFSLIDMVRGDQSQFGYLEELVR